MNATKVLQIISSFAQTFYLCHIFLSRAVGLVCVESAQRFSPAPWERDPQIQRQSACQISVSCVVRCFDLACRLQDSKRRASKRMLQMVKNQTCGLEQPRCCLICVWCKIETVLDASFVFWSDKHKMSGNKGCWKGTYCMFDSFKEFWIKSLENSASTNAMVANSNKSIDIKKNPIIIRNNILVSLDHFSWIPNGLK